MRHENFREMHLFANKCLKKFLKLKKYLFLYGQKNVRMRTGARTVETKLMSLIKFHWKNLVRGISCRISFTQF